MLSDVLSDFEVAIKEALREDTYDEATRRQALNICQRAAALRGRLDGPLTDKEMRDAKAHPAR